MKRKDVRISMKIERYMYDGYDKGGRLIRRKPSAIKLQ